LRNTNIDVEINFVIGAESLQVEKCDILILTLNLFRIVSRIA